MEKLRFKARQVTTGLPGAVMFHAEELVDELANFLREQHRYGRDRKKREPDFELFFDVELRRWYKRRTVPANNLQWELCTRLAAADHVSKEQVHAAVRDVFYPRVEYHGVFAPKDGSELTSVEFAKVIEALTIWCIGRADPIDIYDIWILFTEWRYGLETDPLGGTYSGPEDYKEKHPCCEACGKFLLLTNNYGVQQHNGQLAHIVSRGAGGADADWNWLILCAKCHLFTQHAQGWEELLKLYTHLQEKVRRAREGAGKKALAQPDGAQGQVQAAAESPAPTDETEAAVDPSARTTDVELVKQIFGGEIVAALPAAVQEPSVDEKKERMLHRLKALEGKAGQSRERYYPPTQQSLFDEPPPPTPEPEPVDPKKAQYKDNDKEPVVEPPAPTYNDDGTFAVSPEF